MRLKNINYKEQLQWHITYNQLAKLLYNFALQYKENSGKELNKNEIKFYYKVYNKIYINYIEVYNNDLEKSLYQIKSNIRYEVYTKKEYKG